ncbi:MAG TPA: serine protease [Patescibacteria group bacterium]|nr:serine protease [Patescibacteria group bacterium]
MARFSRLAPLSHFVEYKLAVALVNFFSPLENKKNHELLGIPIQQGKIIPLSTFDFISYIDKKINPSLTNFLFTTLEIESAHAIKDRILDLIKRLVAANILTHSGTKQAYNECYHTLKEYTTQEQKGVIWLTPVLGFSFLLDYLQPYIVQITGKNIKGDTHCGTGILISNSLILTCAHVISDMEVDNEQILNGKTVQVIEQNYHSKIDVGYLKVDNSNFRDIGLCFNNPRNMMDIAIAGYPKIPYSRASSLLLQKGEINGFIQGLDGNNYFLFSAIARPGNSGGANFLG